MRPYEGFVGVENASEVSFAIARLGLFGVEEARWDELSSGYKSRFALAMALLGQPAVLVVDEPLAPLDRHGKLAYMRTLTELARSSRSVLSIVSSNETPPMEQFCDQIVATGDQRVTVHDISTIVRSNEFAVTVDGPPLRS